MFQFRFLGDDTNGNTNTNNITCKWKEAKEVLPNTDIFNEILSRDCIDCFKCGEDIQIKYITSNVADLLSKKIQDCPIFVAEASHSDLLTGIYEGGLKIWECTYDLANFIIADQVSLDNRRILDLGCGAGIIGILALIKGSNVCFQDYNEEIIQYITIPNTYLNSEASSVSNVCRFYSGDWNSFVSLIEPDFQSDDVKYDCIFTSETIYNPENYEKLHAVFRKSLKKGGIIYLAAKTHYFGVGGGLRQFEDFLTEKNVFDFSVCWRCSEGLHREILKITFKKLDI